MNVNNLILKAINAAILAGQKICQVYNSTDFQIETKTDNTPLTLADRLSHQTITKQLESEPIPILSEEGKNIPYEQRKNWNLFWLVDPLDGTKEFIKKNGEFTVNIALIKNNLPIAGVVYVPVKQILYFASEKNGSFKIENISQTIDDLDSLIDKSTSLPCSFPQGGYVIVASRSHMNEQTKNYIDKKAAECDHHRIVSVGSSLKFCIVAEGLAHEYPRFGPTMEWDTAAGHAIVKFSGGKVCVYPNNHELTYNKSSLLNPYFIVKSTFLINEIN